MIAYLASGFGFSETMKSFMYNEYIPKLKEAGIEIINPWDLTVVEEVLEANASINPSALVELRRLIGRRNAEGIHHADLVIANLDGQEVDSGVAWECGYAFALGKAVYGWRSDFRASGELGAKVNLQVEFGITDEIYSSLDELLKTLKEIKNDEKL